MSSIISGVASYLPFRKSSPPAEEATKTEVKPEVTDDSNNENETPEDNTNQNSNLSSDKKTDEVYDPSQQPGLFRKLGSGVYNVTAGTIGAGVGGVKWVAGKSYDAGAAVVGGTKAVVSKVPIPTLKKKDKKE